MGEERRDALTIRQAATLLGVHPNTIRNRVKAGTYQADKVQTENGETYLIPRSELTQDSTTNNLVRPTQSQPLPDVREALQAMLEPFVKELGEVREELGREKERRERAEERIEELERQLEARESLETIEEGPERAEPQSANGGLHPVAEPLELTSLLFRFVWGSLLVGGAAAFSAYMLEDPTFGPLVKTVPLTTVVAGALGGIAGYAGDWQKSFRWVSYGGLITAVVAALVMSFASLRAQELPPGVLLSLRNILATGFLFVSTWGAYVSGALIGNAWQRRRTGRISGTTPASPVSRTTLGAGQPRRWDLTPGQQAILGFVGSIVGGIATICAAAIASAGS